MKLCSNTCYIGFNNKSALQNATLLFEVGSSPSGPFDGERGARRR